jgi:alcohol dehydrogenase
MLVPLQPTGRTGEIAFFGGSGMSMVRAAVFNGTPGRLELRSLPLPNPGAGELTVRILGCTLCGSDLHTYHGRRRTPVPTVLGHEAIGEITAFGPNPPTTDLAGTHLAVGSRVVWGVAASCGNCFFCDRDLPQKCVRLIKFGHRSLEDGRGPVGGLAERVTLPPGTPLMAWPSDAGIAAASFAGCAVSTAAAALEAAGLRAADTALVQGAGLLGLAVTAMLRAAGMTVIVAEKDAGRRARAVEFGATEAVAPDELPEAIAGRTGGRGADAAIEAAGVGSAFTAGLAQLRIGGTMVAVGAVFPGPPVELAVADLVRRQQTVRGIHNYGPRHLRSAVEFLLGPGAKLPWDSLVSAWHPLDEVEAAFAEAANPEAIRVGVRP